MGERKAAPVTTAAFFDAARSLKREITGEGLSDGDVAALNVVIGAWKPAQAAPDASGSANLNPTALSDADGFFAAVRADFGALKQSQVDGFQVLLQAFAIAAWPIAYAAYGIATAWRETNRTMEPVREAYWLDEAWRERNLRYYPWYGRGLVQLTWEKNYRRADDELGLAGALLAKPDMALEPEIAAEIMVKGMAGGWFSGKSLADYLPANGAADGRQFMLARYIINGSDHASEIADTALKFQDALEAGGWA
jgi:putative chitinase